MATSTMPVRSPGRGSPRTRCPALDGNRAQRRAASWFVHQRGLLRPINYGPELWAHVWISRIGSTSYTVHHELHQNNKPCVVAETAIVQLNPETQKPEPMDDQMRQALSSALITE